MTVWLRKSLIWTHRYLGMAVSLLFLMWFLTGIGMMYSRGMPRLTPELRLARLEPLHFDEIRLSADEAARRAGILESPQTTTLLTLLGRPAYRFEGRTRTTVFADNGEPFVEMTLDDATRIASQFLGVPEADVEYRALLTEPDQWTLTLGQHLPMYKLQVRDGSGTEVYVAPRLGEVVQLTSRRGRALAWVSVIPHFLYFRALRLDGELWNTLMTWGPGIGFVVALVGLLLGIMYFRPARPFRFSRLRHSIPFRGWLRWHYAAGLVFGVLALTFVWSGLLSMEPWEWTLRDESLASRTRDAFSSEAGNLSAFPAIDEARWESLVGAAPVREIALASILGEPHFIVRSAPERAPEMGWPDGGHQPYFVERTPNPDRIIISAATLDRREPVEEATIARRLTEAIPDAAILDAEFLTAYDSYYYSREGRSPLPVYRFRLDDPDQTWLYVDPEVGQIVGRINSVNRVERWLYAALHTFDFPFLYSLRPLWDVVIVVFCLGGALLSGMGVLLSARRIVRAFRRASAPASA